jgi:hypothetical protein
MHTPKYAYTQQTKHEKAEELKILEIRTKDIET